jgi:hypothetical protein
VSFSKRCQLALGAGFHKIVSIVLLLTIFLGCATTSPFPEYEALKSKMVDPTDKVVVFCLDGDKEFRSRMEERVAEMLQKWGFKNSVLGSTLFDAKSNLSAAELHKSLVAAGYRGLAEIRVEGEIPKVGYPKTFHLKIEAIPGSPPLSSTSDALWNTQQFFIGALTTLLMVLRR